MTAIEQAFSALPDCNVEDCTSTLQQFLSSSPPQSPMLSSSKRRGGRGFKQPWPMPRAMFILDQRRVPVGRKKSYTLDTFVDEYGPEDGNKRWAAASPENDKTEANAIRELVLVLRGVAASVEPNQPAMVELVHRLLLALPCSATANAEGNRTHLFPRPAAAAVLPTLVKTVPNHATEIVATLLESLSTGETQVIRRSAAVGLASVLKGLGMDSIRAHGVMPHLDRLIHGKSNANGRQGAVFAYECMFHVFGYPFEPYIMKLVPHLVKCFDDNSNVRESAENSAAVIFGHLSAFAVRLITPLSSSQP